MCYRKGRIECRRYMMLSGKGKGGRMEEGKGGTYLHVSILGVDITDDLWLLFHYLGNILTFEMTCAS